MMAKEIKGKEPPTLESLNQRLNMFDDRIDNLDSMVSAVIERVMSQAATLETVCSHCGRKVEVAFIGVRKPR
ncbi:MAG: hypothetical protein FWH42_05230 [Dehalococcoidia bacterium]|nr:hypothetical protein [Dehalococcoidia bacterium]